MDDSPREQHLSDRALSIFAFAAYHQLESGQPVTGVVRTDRSGHKADEGAVEELRSRGLLRVEGNGLAFSESGLKVLPSVLDGLRTAANGS